MADVDGKLAPDRPKHPPPSQASPQLSDQPERSWSEGSRFLRDLYAKLEAEDFRVAIWARCRLADCR